MARHLAAALAAILITWLAPAGDASAQACSTFPSGTGRDLFCRTTAQGGFDCDRSGCHAGASATNNVQKIHNAASWSAIIGAINGGVALMNPGAAFNGRAMTDTEAQDIAAFVASWFSAGPTAPSCTLTSNNTTPGVGASITLTATCSGSPTSYAWTGCASTGPTCTRTEATTGSRTYSVTASNAGGASAPASITINWQATAGPPTPSPTPTPPPSPTPTPTPVPPPPTSQIVEYFHAAFGHYFITNIDAEIAAIDSGRFAGWARTGRAFKAYASNNGYVTAVCRFFTVAFPPKSSHFYTSIAAECNDVRSNNRDWTFEAEAFYVQQADASSGGCPTGFQAVYRLYNNGQGGAPNHRYTTDPAVRAEMMGKGWIPEGFGPEGVGFCAPN